MKTAVDAFLQFCYARHEELLPYPEGPQAALQFISSLGLLCERNCLALQDFTGPPSCCEVATMLLIFFGRSVPPGRWSVPELSLPVAPGQAVMQYKGRCTISQDATTRCLNRRVSYEIKTRP